MSSFVNDVFTKSNFINFKTTMGCSSSSLCFCTVQEDVLIIRVEALACIYIMSLLKPTANAMNFSEHKGNFENAVLPVCFWFDLTQYRQI